MAQSVGGIKINTAFVIDVKTFKQVTQGIDNIGKQAKGMTKSFGSVGVSAKALGGVLAAAFSVRAIQNYTKEAKKLYQLQVEGETKLAQVMKNTMSAGKADIKEVRELAKEQQKLGIISEGIQLAGAQELGTYLTQKESLKALIPVLNDMNAQQNGYNATAEQSVTIATMLGKVMNGQTGALSRYGYTFDKAQEKLLKYGTESQRVATLVGVVSESVGGMNKALANTPLGRQIQLKNTLQGIKSGFGEAIVNISTIFLPFLQRVATWLDFISKLAIRVSSALAKVFGGKELKDNPITSSVGMSGVSSTLGDIVDGYDEVGKAAKKASRGVLSFDNVIPINKPSGAGIENTGGVGSGIVGGLEEVDSSTDSLVGKIEEKMNKLKEFFKDNITMPNLDFNWAEIKENIENTALNITQTFSNLGAFVIDIVFKVWNDADGVGIIEGIISTVQKFTSAIKPAIDAIIPALQNFYNIGIAPIVEWVGVKLKDALGFLGEQFDKIGQWFTDNSELIAQFGQTLGEIVNILWGFIEPIADAAWEGLKVIIGGLVDAFLLLSTWLLENHKAVLLVVAVIGELFLITVGIPALIGKVAAVFTTVTSAVTAFIAPLKAVFAIIVANPLMLIPAAILAIITAIVYLWKTNEGFRDAVINIFNTIKDTIGKFIDFIKDGFVNGFSGSLGIVGTHLDAWVGMIKGVFAGVKQIFGGVVDFIAGVFTGDWDRAFKGLKDIVLGVFKGLASIVMQPFMSVINIWNTIVSKIGTLKIPEWVPMIGGKSFNLPEIPKPKISLADGGVVTKRTWTEIGEAGPEVVFPLKNSDFTQAFARDVAREVRGQGNSNNQQPVQLIFKDNNIFGSDLATIAQLVKKALEQENIRVGGVVYDF